MNVPNSQKLKIMATQVSAKLTGYEHVGAAVSPLQDPHIHTQHKRKGEGPIPCTQQACVVQCFTRVKCSTGLCLEDFSVLTRVLVRNENKILQHAHPPILCLGILKSQCQIRDAWLQFLLTTNTQIPQSQLSNHHHCTFKHQHTINSKSISTQSIVSHKLNDHNDTLNQQHHINS